MVKENNIIEVKQRTVRSLGVMLTREFAMKGLAFLGQLFLFRLLTPKDFGIFAILAFIVNFFQLFTDVGLTSALIQRKDLPSREGLSAALFLKQSLGIIFFLVIVLISPFLHFIYKGFNQEQVQMVRVLALILLLAPMQTFLTALLERELRYEVISFIDILGVFIYQVSAIFFALLKFSVWSFILAILLKEISQVIVVLFYKRWMPTRKINKREIKELLKFGVFIQAQGFLSFFHDALNPFIVGSRIGSYQVGLIDFSTGIVSVNKQVTDNYSRIAFASFSRFQEHPEEQRKTIYQSMVLLSIFGFYFTLIIFGLGSEIIHYAFTDKWLPAMPALYIMTITTLLGSAYAPIVATILSFGRSKELSQVVLVMTGLEWLLSIVGLSFMGFLAVPLAGLITVCISIVWCFRIIPIRGLFSDFLQILLPKIVIVMMLVFLVDLVSGILPQTFFVLVVKGVILSGGYLVLLYVFSRDEFMELLKIKKYIRTYLLKIS